MHWLHLLLPDDGPLVDLVLASGLVADDRQVPAALLLLPERVGLEELQLLAPRLRRAIMTLKTNKFPVNVTFQLVDFAPRLSSPRPGS